MWLDTLSRDESYRFIREVSDLCARLSPPGGLASQLNSWVQTNRWNEVVEYEFDYKADLSYSDFKYSRQIQALLSKQSWIKMGYTPKAKAWSSFQASEVKCRETNSRLSRRAPNGAVSSVHHGAIRKISTCLGDLPPLESFDFSFGPGAATNVKSAEANYRVKLSASLTCSSDLVAHAGKFLEELPLIVSHHAHTHTIDGISVCEVVVEPGKLQFVPKTSKTHRPIVVEPLLNGLLQKGVGSYIKRRLRNFGVDLRDQNRNRALALSGSLSNKLATIDLASASDTVSIATVLDLLPSDWADLLSALRSGDVSSDQGLIHLEKFSSMGNGFTFELESLIFWALTTSTCDYLGLSSENVSIFGDDIISPVEAVPLLIEVLTHFGFEVNPSKSFWDGPFRESCGADWLRGLDIRPYFLRERPTYETLYSFHNWAIRNCERDIADLILSWIPSSIRLFGPDGFGDGHLIGSYSLRTNREVRRRGWGGGYFDTFSRKKKFFKKLLPGDWLVPSYSIYTRSLERDPFLDIATSDPDVVRGSNGYSKISIYTLATSIFRRI